MAYKTHYNLSSTPTSRQAQLPPLLHVRLAQPCGVHGYGPLGEHVLSLLPRLSPSVFSSRSFLLISQVSALGHPSRKSFCRITLPTLPILPLAVLRSLIEVSQHILITSLLECLSLLYLLNCLPLSLVCKH